MSMPPALEAMMAMRPSSRLSVSDREI